MRKLAFIGIGAAAAGLAAIALAIVPSGAQAPKAVADSLKAPVLAAGDTAKLRGPRQPIFFRHDIHAGQYKMQCQYCHYSVAVSPEPGIPSMQTCMGCHLVIGGSGRSPHNPSKKVRPDRAEKKTVEW